MVIENDAENNSQHFANSDHKGNNMLLELLDRPVDKYLPEKTAQWEHSNMEQELSMSYNEMSDIKHLQSYNYPNAWENSDPFINMLHHLCRLRLINCFDFGLEIRQKTIG